METERDRIKLAAGIAAATAILVGAIAWAYAVIVELQFVGGDFCLESTCGDSDPALTIGLAVPAAVGVIAALSACVRLVGWCAQPDPDRWLYARKGITLAAAALGIWVGIIAVLTFL